MLNALTNGKDSGQKPFLRSSVSMNIFEQPLSSTRNLCVSFMVKIYVDSVRGT